MKTRSALPGKLTEADRVVQGNEDYAKLAQALMDEQKKTKVLIMVLEDLVREIPLVWNDPEGEVQRLKEPFEMARTILAKVKS